MGMRFGIGSRLLALAVLNVAALAVVAVIVSLAFGRLEKLSTTIAGKELAGVLDNAALGRDLTATLAEIDRRSRRCGPGATDVGADDRVAVALRRIAGSVQDPQLDSGLATLTATTTRLLDDCARISGALSGIAAIDQRLLRELEALENLTGRALIDLTLAGRNTDHLDQILTLITGYRETLLHIGKLIAGAAAMAPAEMAGVAVAVTLIDDLMLRLQTLTASTPDVVRIVTRTLAHAAAYRQQIVAFDAALASFHHSLGRSHDARETVLAGLQRLDRDAVGRSDRFVAELRALLQESSRQVLAIAAAIALASLLFAVSVLRRHIKQPLDDVLRQIAAIRSGSDECGPVTARADEWGTIHSALHDLSGDLIKTHALLQKVIDTAPIRVFWKDRELRYLGCNPAFARDAGKTHPRELIGKDDYQMTWADQAELYRADDRRVMESGISRLAYEEPQTTPSGDTIWLRTSKVPLRNADEETIGVLGIYEDITAQKQVEAELEQHRSHLETLVAQRTAELHATEARASHILQSSADGLYGVDVDDRITFINPAACALLGYRSEDVIGRCAHALFHHAHADGRPYPFAECPGYRALRDGGEVRVDDEVYWRADGSAVPVMYAFHPMLTDGTVTGAVVSFVDISAQRAAAAAREQALVAAEHLARVRSEFLANMSHEIRTPLNGVLGFAHIGQRNSGDPEKARHAFDRILASGSRLLGVINDILDFSKIEAGKLAIAPVVTSLDETIDRALELVAERARSKGLDLRVEKSPELPETCVCDPLRLGQVLLNLLVNAVKFTDRGYVALAAHCQDGDLIFTVSDSGIGMSADQLGQLFNPFEQADGSTTRRFGGTGLGLAISKRLLELMHGGIRVETALGAGSRFEIRLPYVAPTPEIAALPAPISVPAATRPLAGISILVVEDDLINQMVLAENLRDDGARVVLAGNGREAVERLRRDGPEAYDVVLMDVQMPEMDGLAATRRLHQLAPDLPVIGQTARALEAEREQCRAAGMVAHIAKPIDPDILVAAIREHARRPSSGWGTTRSLP